MRLSPAPQTQFLTSTFYAIWVCERRSDWILNGKGIDTWVALDEQ